MLGRRLGKASIKRWNCSLCGKRSRFLHSTATASEKAPSTAPKPLIDIKSIRQNPPLFALNCLARNYKRQAVYPERILELSERRSAIQKESRGARERSNFITTQLSKPIEDAQARSSLHEEARGLKNTLQISEREERSMDEQIESLAIELPNLTSNDTPQGSNPRCLDLINGNIENQITSFDPSIHDHVALGSDFNIIDFADAGTVSGWGWYFLDNEAATLEQALVQYATTTAEKHGFKHSLPPSITYAHIGASCGFRPRDQNDEQQVYNIQQSKGDGDKAAPILSLAGTAEIPFAGRHAKKVLQARDLPIRLVGSSRCCRAEAGAHGAQGKGLYRVHEFTKVEMFAWTVAGAEQEAFDAMVAVQKEILQSLGFYCRILEMPSMDLGASAFRKWDIEAYFPSRKKLDHGWGEVTSTSICMDYQTRRLNTRVKGVEGKPFPSTVNGTALAVPRILAALLEYGYVPDQNYIRIPEVLWPWMNGIQRIEKK